MQHIFIVGAKGLGNYGGYETFLDKLTECHQDNQKIKYHIACKANGQGWMDEAILQGVRRVSAHEFEYHNAHCFKLRSPDFGTAQAIFYDVKALQYCCKYIKKNHIDHAIVYVLSSRIGPMMGYFSSKIHKLGGHYWNNPDGRENLRTKYKPFVRKYWKFSERLMIKHSDLVVCDSINIEKYIKEEYAAYEPATTFVAYGADVKKSILADDDKKYLNWMSEYNLKPYEFYLSVGRFVEENNFETMIREFMQSDTEKDFVILTNRNEKLRKRLEEKLHYSGDKRIKFVGTVYDKELLKKIRENAYGYFHGHEVGGTNPSLLEALGSTQLNLLFQVGFNQEVAEDAALYWTKETGSLSRLIAQVEELDEEAIDRYGEKSVGRIIDKYSWNYIAEKYERLFMNLDENS